MFVLPGIVVKLKQTFYPSYVSVYACGFSPNAGKYGPEKTSYFDTFHAVCYF